MAKAPEQPSPQPITPDEVYDTFDSKRVDEEIRNINKYLRDKINAECLLNPDSVCAILTDRNLTDSEREAVAEMFEGAGWSKVESRTSAENGERPGLIQWTLYR